jgi:hypothetical protein
MNTRCNIQQYCPTNGWHAPAADSNPNPSAVAAATALQQHRYHQLQRSVSDHQHCPALVAEYYGIVIEKLN